jgi:hypothetical protein
MKPENLERARAGQQDRESAKPETFKPPVAWLGGRDLLANLNYFLLFAAFKGKLDPRDWMAAEVFPTSEVATGAAAEQAAQPGWRPEDYEQPDKGGEFWFDYVSDSGDGQAATYNLAYLCLSDLCLDVKPGSAADAHGALKLSDYELRIRFNELLEQDKPGLGPSAEVLRRGAFLFFGGDTTYHVADYASLADRFQGPFIWAFNSRRQDLAEVVAASAADAAAQAVVQEALTDLNERRRPIFGIPGNHDYYDMLDGFNRQFGAPLTAEDGVLKVEGREMRPQLSLPGFVRCQRASYVALRLPFGWWFWGLDSEVKDLDLRQQAFFRRVYQDAVPENERVPRHRTLPAKLILATPEPTTVNWRRAKRNDKTARAIRQLGLDRPFLRDGVLWNMDAGEQQGNGQTCRLDISGDTHHYARYWGPATPDSAPAAPVSANYASLVSGSGGAAVSPTHTKAGAEKERVMPRVAYPDAAQSRKMVAERIFDPRTVIRGGNIYLFGLIIAAMILLRAWLQWLTGKSAWPSFSGASITDRLYDLPMVCLASGAQTGLSSGNYLRLIVFLVLAICLIAASGLYAWWLFQRLNKSLDRADPSLMQVIERRGNPGIRPRDRWQCWLIFAGAIIINLVFAGGLLHKVWQAGNNDCVLQSISVIFVPAAVALALGSCYYAWWAFRPFKPTTDLDDKPLDYKIRLEDVQGQKTKDGLKRPTLEEVLRTNAAPPDVLRRKVSDLIVTPVMDYLPFGVLFLSAAISLVYVLLEFMQLTKFGVPHAPLNAQHVVPRMTASVLILLTGLLAAAAALCGIFYSAGLFKQAYQIKVTFHSYWPVRAYAAFAVVCVLAGVLFFDGYDMRQVVVDILFVLVVGGVLLGLIYFGWSVGGLDLKLSDRFVLAALGLWHAVVQLLVPFLLVWRGNWLAQTLALLVVPLFASIGRWLSTPKRGATVAGERRLWLVWLLYGLLLISLPVFLPTAAEQRFFHIPASLLPHVSFTTSLAQTLAGLWTLVTNAAAGLARLDLQPAVVAVVSVWVFCTRLLTGFLSWSPATLALPPVVVAGPVFRLLAGLLLAGLYGALFSCVWFGWYLASALAFNGHNNEVGSTVRSEQYKQFVRFRLKREPIKTGPDAGTMKETLTAYVIGVDDYAKEARALKPRLIDHFTLEVPRAPH